MALLGRAFVPLLFHSSGTGGGIPPVGFPAAVASRPRTLPLPLLWVCVGAVATVRAHSCKLYFHCACCMFHACYLFSRFSSGSAPLSRCHSCWTIFLPTRQGTDVDRSPASASAGTVLSCRVISCLSICLRDILIAFVGCCCIAFALCSFAAYSHLAALASLPLSVWLWWGPLLVSRLDGVHYVHWLLCQRVLEYPSVSTPAIECVGISIVFISRPS